MKHNKPVKLFHITTGLSEGQVAMDTSLVIVSLLFASPRCRAHSILQCSATWRLRNFLLAAFLVLAQSNDSLCSLQVQELHKREAVKCCSLNRCTFSPNLKKQPWPQIYLLTKLLSLLKMNLPSVVIYFTASSTSLHFVHLLKTAFPPTPKKALQRRPGKSRHIWA